MYTQLKLQDKKVKSKLKSDKHVLVTLKWVFIIKLDDNIWGD